MDQTLSARDAEVAARELYDLEARAEPLPGYADLNFQLECEQGRFVLKISRPDADTRALDLQARALAHLARTGLALRTPAVVPTKAGDVIGSLQLASGRAPHPVRLLSYLEGRRWVDAKHRTPELHHDLGRRLGELDVALAQSGSLASHPAAERHEDWDLAQAIRQRPYAAQVEDPRRRAIAEDVFHRFAACAVPRFGELRRSLIHSDANDYNLLVDGDPAHQIAGLIDFGDLVLSHTVCDPAIALAYAMLGEDEPLRVATEIVAGYHETNSFEEPELEVLFPLAMTRVAVSAVVAGRMRRERPENTYLTVNEAPAWRLLEQLADVSPRTAESLFLEACGQADENAAPEAGPAGLLADRGKRIGSNLSISYERPLKITRGRGQYLYDHRGRPFLDLVNNVCHVGHCHPRVVEAGQRQMARLNTNTRYLYRGLTDYAARLAATLPSPLEVCYFVCSGSEANELALRLARAHTGRRDLLVLEGAYHGHTGGLIDISPYKFRGPGGRGEPEPWVHVVPVPDGYRGPYKGSGPKTGALYAAEVEQAIHRSQAPIAAYIAESLLGCGGQIVPPEGYLSEVYRHVRGAGGLCIVDEVQVGFGRVGERFWGFELQGVVPDIVVLGKPIGNGHPMAAVVTTPEIAASFANGMEFFSTFGGNPVSCAIGMAVLDVLEDEGLQERALRLGRRFQDGLRALAERHPLIGEVRGRGLFLGVELVRDRQTLEPADREASTVVEHMRKLGILLSTDGPLHNVIKIKPPMVLSEGDIDFTLRQLDWGFDEL